MVGPARYRILRKKDTIAVGRSAGPGRPGRPMGNVALTTTCAGISVVEGWRRKKVVTVLKQDGAVLEFDRQFRVSKLLRDFPGHFVCKSEELGGGKAAMLSPNTLLRRGKVYLVLFHAQIHQYSSRKCGSQRSKINPLLVPPPDSEESPRLDDRSLDNSKRCQRIRLVMTKHQLAKMLSDGSILMRGSDSCSKLEPNSLQVLSTRPGSCRSSTRLFSHPRNQITCVRGKRSWCPELDSIVEVPSQ